MEWQIGRLFSFSCNKCTKSNSLEPTILGQYNTLLSYYYYYYYVFPHDISKTAAARTTERDVESVEMVNHESWKAIYFGIKRSKIKVTRHKKCRRGYLHFCECWFLPVMSIYSDTLFTHGGQLPGHFSPHCVTAVDVLL